jgi:hypothetical protein
MREKAARPVFAAKGSTELKPWFGSNCGLKLPAEIDIAIVEAIPPYNEQIAELDKQVGAVFARQPMKDASGASQMDPRTQVTHLHGVSMLNAAQSPLESNIALALLHESGGPNDRALVDVAICAYVNLHGDAALAAAEAARASGNAPNTVMAAACTALGPARLRSARGAAQLLVELFSEAKLRDAMDDNFDFQKLRVDARAREAFTSGVRDPRAEAMLAALDARGAKSVFVRYLQSLGGNVTSDAVLAAITTTVGWAPLLRRRISRVTLWGLPWWMQLMGAMIGASVPAERHEQSRFCGVSMAEILNVWSVTELAGLSLLGKKPDAADLASLQTLIGLLLTNGPGTISAQGAKGAVAADGPETPDRVHLNKAVIGFLTHSGYAHGGNGYEGIAFLMDQFREVALTDPAKSAHGLDLKAMADRYAAKYADYKSAAKAVGALELQKIPGVHHPVFRDKAVNLDPREVFISDVMRSRGEYNVFHEYYHAVVQALYDAGLSRNVYCVNIDAVIAALLLKMMWKPYRAGLYTEANLETAAFTVFLYGRMIGCAAEIDDHLNRGRNMDTRTPASDCRFVA